MAKSVRFDRRMSDHEALMWALEDDPVLRSAFANVTITDRPVDVALLRTRMATTVERIVDMLDGWPGLNEFKHTTVDR